MTKTTADLWDDLLRVGFLLSTPANLPISSWPLLSRSDPLLSPRESRLSLPTQPQRAAQSSRGRGGMRFLEIWGWIGVVHETQPEAYNGGGRGAEEERLSWRGRQVGEDQARTVVEEDESTQVFSRLKAASMTKEMMPVSRVDLMPPRYEALPRPCAFWLFDSSSCARKVAYRIYNWA